MLSQGWIYKNKFVKMCPTGFDAMSFSGKFAIDHNLYQLSLCIALRIVISRAIHPKAGTQGPDLQRYIYKFVSLRNGISPRSTSALIIIL